MDPVATYNLVSDMFDAALPALQEFVQIPNISPATDPEWATNGLLEKACHHSIKWVEAQGVEGCTAEFMKDEGFSPFVYIEIAGTSGSDKAKSTFVMYGHLDKQPHGPGWEPDIDPVGGLIKDGRVYGRGSADDGYAVYSCIIAVKALQQQKISHPRVIIILETSEESGSPHLGHYVEKLTPRMGQPAAVFCLDSIVEDYTRLWMTTSLRGVIMGRLEVSVLYENLHSGFGGGIVPDAFRVLRQLLARLEDPETGKVLLPELHTKIPVERQAQMKELADAIPRPDVQRLLPFQKGASPQHVEDPLRMYLANTWEPSLAVVGMGGLPDPSKAGNVLQNTVSAQLSIRTPPLVDCLKGAKAVKETLERDPPYGAKVVADFKDHVAPGWDAVDLRPNLEKALSEACKAHFDGKDIGFCGVGGTIPLLGMLAAMFPSSDLICTGVLGPGTNMHGPNEHLPIEYTKKVTAAMAQVMGILEVEAAPAWPEGVPRPPEDSSRRPNKKARFCFSQPTVPVGQCLCCL